MAGLKGISLIDRRVMLSEVTVNFYSILHQPENNSGIELRDERRQKKRANINTSRCLFGLKSASSQSLASSCDTTKSNSSYLKWPYKLNELLFNFNGKLEPTKVIISKFAHFAPNTVCSKPFVLISIQEMFLLHEYVLILIVFGMC